MNKLKPLRRFGPYRTHVWLSDAQDRERVITNALRRVLTSCECEDCSDARAILAQLDAEKEATDATE